MKTEGGHRCVCLIEGCRRTTAIPYTQWLCPRHWSLVPKATRRAYALAKRRRKSAAAIDRLWLRARRLAIETANDDLFGPQLRLPR